LIATVLFIGNFLSKSRGSYSISEFIADHIEKDFLIETLSASTIQNQFLRLLHIVVAATFRGYTHLQVDVFSGNSFLVAQIATYIGKVRRKKIILTLHGGRLHEFYLGHEEKFARLFKGAYIQSPSMFLKTFFESHHFTINHCPNPIDLKRFPYHPKQDGGYNILWVRAFTSIYNPQIPILVLEKMLKEYPLATLTMIGPDRGLMAEIKKLTERLNLNDSVTITGPIRNEELAAYYHSHTVYLNTTSYESFGVAVVEAASSGIPVVSFSVGEIPFLWKDEENILLAPQLDVDAMAHQIKRIFDDERLRNRIVLNARKRAEGFSWENIKLHWLQLLSK
jgi:glycosyltransferase involved in cell wall biosynthesis